MHNPADTGFLRSGENGVECRKVGGSGSATIVSEVKDDVLPLQSGFQ